jgi:hypothetical protein
MRQKGAIAVSSSCSTLADFRPKKCRAGYNLGYNLRTKKIVFGQHLRPGVESIFSRNQMLLLA